MKKTNFLKTLLVAVGLLMGGVNSAWADTVTLLNIDYSSTTTPAWTVVGGSGSIENGAWKHVQGGGGGNRSAYIDFGIASSIDDNWTVEFDAALKPGSDRNDQQITVAGAKTTYTNNTSATGYMYFAVKEETNGGTTYTVKIGNTDVATGVTLSNGTTYHFRVIYDGTTSAVTAYIGDTKYEGTAAIENVGKLRGLHGCVARYNGAITYDNIVVTKEVDEEVVSNPSIDIVYAAANRTVTITSGESSSKNPVTTYYTIDGTDPSASNYAGSFTTASKEITIMSNCTLKAISISSSDVASSVSSLAITVGKVSLATPTISASGFTNVDGVYVLNPTFNFTCNNSAIPGTPEATLSYTFTPDGGAESSPVTATSFTPTTKGTLKVIASNNNYLSSEKTLVVSNGYTVSYTGRDYSTATHEDITATTWGSASTVTWAGWESGLTAYSATTVITDDQHLNIANGSTISLVEGWGWVRGDQKTYGYRVRYAKEGDFIALKENSSKGADASATVYQTTYSGSGTGKITDYVTITAPESYAIQQLYHYSPAVVTEVDLAINDCKKYETSSAFATAVAAESFSTAAQVYVFHTAWQIAQAKASGSKDLTKLIRNAAIADATDWDGANLNYNQQYTGATDNTYIDIYNNTINTNQTIYGVPAGTYKIKAATRAAVGTSGTLYVNDGTSDIAKVSQITNVGNTGGDLGNGWSWSEMTFTLTETKNLLIGFWADARSSKWAGCDDWHMELVGVSATIGSTGWTTFASPYALNLSDMTASTGDVTAYYASTVTGGYVKMTETNKADVKAGEGLALYGTPSAVITIPVVASGTAIGGNLLKGCTTETVLSQNADYYVLVNNNGTAEFQCLADRGATIPAGKAYLDAPTAGARLSIMFDDDETTGLGRIENSESRIENSIFNLNGQKVAQPTKGLYIKNGKKVIVK